MAQRVGYIGAGVMGAGIVKNLRKNGFPVSFIVHANRARVPELVAAGAVEVKDYKALADASDIIMMTVPDSSVVEPLLLAGQLPGRDREAQALLRLGGEAGLQLHDAPLRQGPHVVGRRATGAPRQGVEEGPRLGQLVEVVAALCRLEGRLVGVRPLVLAHQRRVPLQRQAEPLQRAGDPGLADK